MEVRHCRRPRRLAEIGGGRSALDAIEAGANVRNSTRGELRRLWRIAQRRGNCGVGRGHYGWPHARRRSRRRNHEIPPPYFHCPPRDGDDAARHACGRIRTDLPAPPDLRKRNFSPMWPTPARRNGAKRRPNPKSRISPTGTSGPTTPLPNRRGSRIAAPLSQNWERGGGEGLNHDTIGSAPSIRRAISPWRTTSGMAWKVPGRVGDSPIIGCGLYVDNAVGGAAAPDTATR